MSRRSAFNLVLLSFIVIASPRSSWAQSAPGSYAVGLTFEYPLGNRQRNAEYTRRRLEQRKAVSTLHTTADEVAVSVKENFRRIRMNLAEVKVQREAAEAARMHLVTLEQAEEIRDKLTPEFLLVKLQAQETYAQARRAEVNARVGLNVGIAELAQNTGTILDMRMVQPSLESIVDTSAEKTKPQETPASEPVSPFPPRSPSL